MSTVVTQTVLTSAAVQSVAANNRRKAIVLSHDGLGRMICTSGQTFAGSTLICTLTEQNPTRSFTLSELGTSMVNGIHMQNNAVPTQTATLIEQIDSP